MQTTHARVCGRKRRYLPFILGLTALAAVAGCGHGPGTPAPGTPPPGAAPAPAAGAGPKGAPWAGVPLRGNSQAAIRAYLASVEEVKPTKFKVEWNPATVAIDKAAAMRSLRGVSHDGSTFVLSSAEPAVAKLKPGSILWIYDIAIRKVDSVETFGEVTRVHTTEVKLTEAMPNAEIEFEAPVKLQNYFPQRLVETPTPQGTARWRRHSDGFVLVGLTDLPPENLPDPNAVSDETDDDWYDEGMSSNGYTGTKGGWAYSVGYQTRSGGITVELQARKGDVGGSGDTGGSTNLIPEYKAIEVSRKEIHDGIDKAEQELRDEEKGVRQTDADFEQEMAQLLQDQANRNNPRYNGPGLPPQVNEYGHPITDQAAQQRLKDKWEKKHDLELKKLQATEQILGEWRIKKDQLEARKRALKAAAGVAKQLFDVIDDNFDARFRARVDLDGFAAGANLGFVNSNIDVAATQFKNLNGEVRVQFIGRLGAPGNQASKVPVMHLPVQFNVPMPVGGIPFVVQVGSDFLITIALSGMNASMTAEGRANFNGNSGFTYAKGNASYDTSFNSGEPRLGEIHGMSPGVSAVVLGIQLPRIGLGLGVFGVSSVAYVDIVNVVTMTQGGSVGAGLLPACKRITYNTVGHVGIETNIVPLPFVSTEKITNALTQKREIFNNTKERLEPNIKGCMIGPNG